MMKTSLRLIILSVCVLACGTGVFAQSTSTVRDVTKPLSSVDSVTNNELRSIYRQDVGQGFTSQSLNAISLQNARAQVGYFGQSSAGRGGGTSAPVSTLAPSRASKPFNSVSSSPTVSPYMNLFREDFDGGGDLNYQTLVRPQLQQMQYNQQFERQNLELSRRVQSISAQGAYKNPAGSESIYPTGHQTAFGYYGRYYPGMSQPRGR